MTVQELYAKLSAPIPKEFLMSYTEDGKTFTTFNAQYAIDLLNSELGLDEWVTEETILQQGQTNGKWLVVMQIKVTSDKVDASGYGAGYGTADTAYKAAKTSAFKNACRYLGIGKELYLSTPPEEIKSTGVANIVSGTLTETAIVLSKIEQATTKQELEEMKEVIKKSNKEVIDLYNKKLISMS